MADLILVRHGETVGNSAIRFYGATDVALSDAGRRQMRAVGHALADHRFDRAVVSPLSRSRESCALVLDGRGPDPEVVAGFREIDFGRWEGWTVDEIADRDPEGFRHYEDKSASFGFPGGETREGFRSRIVAATREVLATLEGQTLAVLHKGVTKVILGTLLDEPPAVYMPRPVELGSIHRLRRDDDGTWRLLAANETAHLGETRIPTSR